MHEPALILLSARAVSNDTSLELDTEGLVDYGITLSITDGTPSVVVYSSNTGLSAFSFDLAISSTVSEEPFWQNT